MRRILILTCLVLAASPASAVTIMLHNSSGRDCYMATILEPTPENNRKALAACDQAVADAGTGTDAYDHAAALVNRADVRLRTADYAGAVEDAKQAIALYRDLSQAYLNFGAGMVGLKRYDEALPLLNKAIDLNGGEPERAYFDRALAKESLGDIRGAYYDYRKAVEINPNYQPASTELTRFKIVVSPG